MRRPWLFARSSRLAGDEPLHEDSQGANVRTSCDIFIVRDAETPRIHRLEKPGAVLHRASPAADAVRAEAGTSGLPAI